MSDPPEARGRGGGGEARGTRRTAQRHFGATVSDGQERSGETRELFTSPFPPAPPRGKKPDVLARRAAGRSLVRAYGLLTFIF